MTVWYTLIILTISLLFSAVIYRGVSFELERGFHRAEGRLKAQEFILPFPLPDSAYAELIQDLENSKQHVLYTLFIINGLILVFSALTSYILAGKTLTPIQNALEEQKRFVTDASHELHTPLTALKTSIEVALRDKKLTSSEAKRVLSQSLVEVDELAGLSENLLSLARLEKNGHSQKTRVDLIDTVKNVVKRLKPLADKKEITLDIQTETQVLTIDEVSLTKLLTILLENAIKYTPQKGNINVISKAEGKHLKIAVKDTGIGISKHDLTHIFDRFYRADSSRTRDGASGFGLGLAIAKRIVDLQYGEITVTSKVGRGTTFVVSLPLKV